MELKINALKKRGLLDTEHDFEEIPRANRDEDIELERNFKEEIELLKEEEKADFDVYYEQWESVKTGEISKNTKREKKVLKL